MFKTKIILDKEKITANGLSMEQCTEKLDSILDKLHFHKDSKDGYILEENGDDLSARLCLLFEFKRADFFTLLKEWKTFDDSESPDGAFEEVDFLNLLKKEGIA